MNLEEIIAAVVYRAGVEALARRTFHRRKAGVIVYHDPTPERLEAHLRFLHTRYHFVTLTELVAALRCGDWSGIPANSLVITLDDGHRGNLELPSVFARYGVRPTIFITTGTILGDGLFWFKLPEIEAGRFKLLTPVERDAALTTAVGLAHESAERHALTPEEVRELAEVADFGSHSVTHPILPLCSDPQAAEEIAHSRRDVEELTGSECLHFCFPNGDFAAREIELVRQAGYLSARTTDAGWITSKSDPFRLPIVSGADDASLSILATHLTGLLRVRRFFVDRRRRRRLAARVASLERSAR